MKRRAESYRIEEKGRKRLEKRWRQWHNRRKRGEKPTFRIKEEMGMKSPDRKHKLKAAVWEEKMYRIEAAGKFKKK